MSESKEKIKDWNNDVVKTLKKRYGYTADYIRKSVNGDRVGIIPDKLKKEYLQMAKAAKEAIEQTAKEQMNS